MLPKLLHDTSGKWNITTKRYRHMTKAECFANVWLRKNAGEFDDLHVLGQNLISYLKNLDKVKVTVYFNYYVSGRYIDGSVACHCLSVRLNRNDRWTTLVRSPFYEKGDIFED